MIRQKILIIDDEPDFIEMVKMRLEANAYDVITAENGQEGVDAAKEQKPSLILLDVMMPGMDGFSTLRALQRDGGTRTIPVVMLTAKGETKSIMKAQELGSRDYLIKPCPAKELLEVVGRYARR